MHCPGCIIQSQCADIVTHAGGRSIVNVGWDSGDLKWLITENTRLAGIFTERDVLLFVLGNDDVLAQPVTGHMTPDPVCVGTEDPVRQVLMLMYQRGHRHIPIVDAARQVAGCVRHKDIAECLVNHFAAYVLNLPPDPEQIARTPEGG